MKVCEIHKIAYKVMCSECLHVMAKAEKQAARDVLKLSKKVLSVKQLQWKKRTPISKDPQKWQNTFLCSDGTQVTQAEINFNRSEAYKAKYPTQTQTCHGCWKRKAQGSAHTIAQARCKNLGKTELIWHPDNFFPACLQCNSAIENPNGKNWKGLLNIEPCLAFIKLHDKELWTKFELSAVNQDNESTI